ncbi:ead/Ea22-like family protein [Cronobacter turicensis]|nr:ead/Ea22-like family protein [Cronobacter turicensis]
MNTAKLKAAALAATPGPWTHDGCGGICADVGLNGCYFVAECEGDDWGNNSEFIALANPAAVLELIAALEAAEKRNAEMSESNRILCADSMIKQDRIAELEARTVALPRPACTYADHSYPAYSEQQVVELLESLGINLETGG